MIVLSMLALMAHNCMFPIMKTEPLAYLLYLMYFRSRHCSQQIVWTYLGLEGQDLPFVEPKLPLQAAAVSRTFAFAILYLNLNILLTLCAVSSLCKLHQSHYGVQSTTFH